MSAIPHPRQLHASVLDAQSVLITGGTGSFGRAFLRTALTTDVRRVAVFSRDELKQAELLRDVPDPRLRTFIGDVRDRDRLRLALQGVTIVVHAAAMKRIETCEADPFEAVATNILGTQHVALEAIRAGVSKAVFLSTDKAPIPHTLYGSTKLVAERLWVQSNVYSAGTGTRLAATRYGNVLGSRGSVLDLWRTQVARGEPVSITDERMTRFWMRIEDAVELVFLALSAMEGGEVFIPKCGGASVLDLARAVAEGPCGEPYAPGHTVTGLRPGERMHETLVSSDESRTTLDCGSHYLIEPEHMTWGRRARGANVPLGFTYRSDTNPTRLNVAQLREMIA